MSTFSRAALRCLTAGLLLFSVAMAVKGPRHAWVFDGDTDMQARVRENDLFRRGVYPTRWLEPDVPKTLKITHTVYPPYALPMFVPFFEPFGKLQGRIVVELLTLVSIFAIGAYGYRLLRDAGPDAAWLGAFAAAAISGNGNAIALGQFSIICAGAIVMQLAMLERGRPLAAGAWWALAMLKPQIGVAFAGVFLARREWRGLACGLGILAGLALAACWWTEVSPLAVVEYWTLHMNVRFAEGHSLPSRLAAILGVQPRVIHLGLASLLLMLVPILFSKRLVALTRVEPLFLAGIAALLGGTLLYHHFYDNVMMFPLLFAALAAAAHRPTPGRLVIAAAVGASLWIPQQILAWAHAEWLRPAIWTVGAIAMFVGHVRTAPAQAGPTLTGTR